MRKISECVALRGDFWRTVAPQHIKRQREHDPAFADEMITTNPASRKRMLFSEVNGFCMGYTLFNTKY